MNVAQKAAALTAAPPQLQRWYCRLYQLSLPRPRHLVQSAAANNVSGVSLRRPCTACRTGRGRRYDESHEAISGRFAIRSPRFAAAGTLRAHTVHRQSAAGHETATVWWTQGFVPEEDAAVPQDRRHDYQKQSGSTIDYWHLVALFAAADAEDHLLAITSSDVPDLISHDVADAVDPSAECLGRPQDRRGLRCHVESQKDSYSPPAVYLASMQYAIIVLPKKRGSVFHSRYKDCTYVPFHIWTKIRWSKGRL